MEVDEVRQTPYFLSKRLVLKHRDPQTRDKERIVLRRRLPGEVVDFSEHGMEVRFHPRGQAPIILYFGHYEDEGDYLYMYFDNTHTYNTAIFKLQTSYSTVRHRDKDWRARYRSDYSLIEDLLNKDDEFTGEGDGKNDIPPHLVFR
jgi:hypothetical protein